MLPGGMWQAHWRIGGGTFSEVYALRNVKTGSTLAAAKVERAGQRPTVELESVVLAYLQRYPFFPRLYGLV